MLFDNLIFGHCTASALQTAPSGYTAGMSDEQTSHRHGVPYIWLSVVLLLFAYAAAYYSLSTVRILQDSRGRTELRDFGSRGALIFFSPITFVEKRVYRERRFGYLD
jgi:hypothetical protein